MNDLFRDELMDIYRNPMNQGQLDDRTHRADGKNPLCGDQVNLQLKISDGKIQDAKFNGSACSISIISSALLTEHIIGKTVEEAKKINTKKGDAMMFVKIEDSGGEVELLVFPRMLEQNPHIWQEENIIACVGKISDKDGEVKIICNQVAYLEKDNVAETFELLKKSNDNDRGRIGKFFHKLNPHKKISIKITEPIDYDVSKSLRNLFYEYPGNHHVELLVERVSGNKQRIKTSFRINHNDRFKNEVANIIDSNSIVIE